MKTIEYKQFNDKEDLELKFFKELNIEVTPIDEEIKEGLKNLLDLYGDKGFLRITKIIDRKVIGYGEVERYASFYIFDNVLNLKEGEIIYFKDKDSRYGEKKEAEIFKIDKQILNKDFLDESIRIDLEDLKIDEVLKKEDVEKEIKKKLEKRKGEEEREKQQEEDEKEIERENKEKYENESIGNFNSAKINKNIIDEGNYKIILNENANKVLDYDYFNDRWVNVLGIKRHLVEEKKDFVFEEENEKIFDIKFENNPKKNIIKSLTDGKDTNTIKINGIRVRKGKVNFILDRIDKDTTNKEIKLLNKLTGMKASLVKLKSIILNGDKETKIDIEISIINEDDFNVKVFGIKKKMGWGLLKQHFFSASGRSISYHFTAKTLIDFGCELGLTKQDIFNYLKKIKIVESLKEDEN